MDKVKVKILFVCTGNTCRSPMAEFMFKEYLKEKKCGGNFSVSSEGLYAERGAVLSDGADKALEALGVKHTMRKARMLTVQMCNDADVIIAVTNEHARACGDGAYSFERFTGRPVLDPYGGSLRVYLDCAAQMRSAFDGIYDVCADVYDKKANARKD